MKQLIRCIVFLLSMALLTPGCTQQQPQTVEEDGGQFDHSVPDAPKAITSNEIIAFDCEFSTLAFPEEDTSLGGCVYRLKANLKNGQVTGGYQAYDRFDERVSESFTADADFMVRLQKIVDGHELARFNGHHVSTQGLGEQYGAELSVRYASGETISASDNEDNFLPIETCEAFVRLFSKQIAAETPAQAEKLTALPLTYSLERMTANTEACYLYASFPIIDLGYTDEAGELHTPEGFGDLEQALSLYNQDVYEKQQAEMEWLHSAAFAIAESGDDIWEIYSQAEAVITRSDSLAVSFYEHTQQYEGQDEQHLWRAYNIDAQSGAQLSFDDVFTRPDELPAALAHALRAAYPHLEFPSDTDALLAESMYDRDGDLCFALGYGLIHFFAADGWLTPGFGGQHITLLLSDYPSLVRSEYAALPESMMIVPEYDIEYPLIGGGTFSMGWQVDPEDEMNILWQADVNGHAVPIEYFGYAPECLLICAGGQNYLYIRIPAGDISLATEIYRIKETGLEYIGEVDFTWDDMLNLDPQHMLMEQIFIYTDQIMLFAGGLYRIGADGLPEAASDVFGLSGPPLRTQEEFRMYLLASEQADASAEPVFVSSGELLTPLRTDMRTYMDFYTEDENLLRFDLTETPPSACGTLFAADWDAWVQ